jgi:tetratricopeptide (TPR) repeat protein
MPRLFFVALMAAWCFAGPSAGVAEAVPQLQASDDTVAVDSMAVDTASLSPDSLYAVQTPDVSLLDDPFVRTKGKKGLNHLYNLEFKEARALFNRIDERYPDHPVGPFLKGLNIWWEILLDLPDTSHDEAFYRQMNEVIDRCNEILDEDPDHFDAAFFKGAALGFRGRLRSNRDSWIRAAYDGKRAIGYVRDVAERAPRNNDYVFGKGMYDYYAAIIPEEYPVSKTVMWMMPDGDKERGLSLIRRAAEHGWYIQTEAAYFLTQIHYLYENNFHKARRYVSWLRRQHPKNAYFHTLEGRVYAKWGRWEKVRSIFETALDRHRDGWTGYNKHAAQVARFFLARVCMHQDRYQEALSHLAELERLTKGDENVADYRVTGYLYQGMVYDALGRRSMAVSRYKTVLRLEDHWDAHQRARNYLTEPYGG